MTDDLFARWHAMQRITRAAVAEKLGEDGHPIVERMHDVVGQILTGLLVIARDENSSAEELRAFANEVSSMISESSVPPRAF